MPKHYFTFDTTDIVIFSVILALIFALVALFFAYVVNNLRKENEEEREHAKQNLGLPMDLEDLKERKFWIGNMFMASNNFLLLSFTPIWCTGQKDTAKWVHGVAHLALPGKPNELFSVSVILKADEEVEPNNTTLYRITPKPNSGALGLCYLLKVK